jgi:hypothetical protein
MDISTGLQSSVNFQILGLGASSDYLSNADYHAATDTLWIHDLFDDRSFYVDNASQQFGVASSNVPDGGSTALMLGLGLIGFGVVRTPRRAG